MDYCIIALGNPGEQYTHTRHNVGWIILDQIFSPEWSENKYARAQATHIDIEDVELLLIKPITHMNRSGEVIDFFKKEYALQGEKLIVIHDDIDLPLGRVKISFDRGDGGHNGVRSIMDHLGSKEFIRIRIGVSTENEGKIIKPNVLGNFSEEEQKLVKTEISEKVKNAILAIVKEGIERAMNITHS